MLSKIRKLLAPAPAPQPPKDPKFERVLAFSMSTRAVLQNLHGMATDVQRRGVPGDFVECGVCNGGSAAAICLAFADSGRKAWLYDSFEGMPETRPIDGPDAAAYHGKCVGAVEQVRAAVAVAGFPEADCIIRKGWFDKTFAEELPEKVAFLHVDCDWYDSVMLTLETFYDRVVEGGVIVLDDFGHWEGCREAFYDFIGRRNLKPLLERCGHTEAWWVKGKQHNRTQ